MSLQCPMCEKPMGPKADECAGCGWQPPSTRPVKIDLPPDKPLRPHTGAFHSVDELSAYEQAQSDTARQVREAISHRKHELEGLPHARRWAGEIMLRWQARDPRLTPATLQAAKDALVNFPAVLGRLSKRETHGVEETA